MHSRTSRPQSPHEPRLGSHAVEAGPRRLTPTRSSMARYWWQCISCGDKPAWLTVCDSRSIAAFIWDELAPSGWDQRLLRRRCKCKRHALRITYRFRRGDPERVSIEHIVGLAAD